MTYFGQIFLLISTPIERLTSSEIFLRLSLVFLLIAINAFFVVTEFAIVSVRRTRINQLVASGDLQAKTVQNLQTSIDRLLSTTQIGITLSSLALGWIGERAIANLLAHFLLRFNLGLSLSLIHGISIPVTFILLAYLQIVLGELIPKSLALLYSEQIARFLSTPSLTITRVFTPIIWILNRSTRYLLKIAGIQESATLSSRLTSEELQLIINTDRESTGLGDNQRELLNNMFDLSALMFPEIMIPRTKIVSINIDSTIQEFSEKINQTNINYYPVIDNSLDEIIGIISSQALAKVIEAGINDPHTTIAPWVQPRERVLFIPENPPITISDLLEKIQKKQSPLAIVVDEFGQTVGLVSQADIMAEIFAPKYPTYHQHSAIQLLNKIPLTYQIQAQINLSQLNDLLNLDIPVNPNYQTLAGFVLYKMQHIPETGESFTYNDLKFTITATSGKRIDKVIIDLGSRIVNS